MTTSASRSPDGLTIYRIERGPCSAVVATHVGLARDNNEDFYGASDSGLTYAIADGMGGHDRGEDAARAAVHAAVQNEHTVSKPVTMRMALKRATDEARRAVRLLGENERGRRQPDTTIVVATIDLQDPSEKRAGIAWIGDSRAYLWSEGSLRRITEDHAVKHFLLRSVGQEGDASEPDYAYVTMPDGAWLLLTTDGVHGVVSERYIADCLRVSSREHALNRIAYAVLGVGAPDNFTAMIVKAGNA